MKKEPRSPASLQLPLTGADSHAHLIHPKLWPDFEQVMARAVQAGVATIGQIFLSHKAYMEKIDLMAAYPQLFFCLGIHPSDVLKWEADELDTQAAALAQDDRLLAVGEIGLDFYHDDAPPEKQEWYFRQQLRTAKKVDKPVVIHSRDAFSQTVAILDEEGFDGYPVLWHCFGGDAGMADALVKRGWHISIPGPVTYPANQALREAVAVIPLDRLMVETDCPYLSPQEWRGKTNEPALCAFAAEAVALARGMNLEELWTQCGENTRHFFGLK